MSNTIEDPILGSFEWDEEFRYWRGTLTFSSGRSATLEVPLVTEEHANHPDSSTVFEATYPIVAWLRMAETEAYEVVSSAMLGLYNGNWSEEPPITVEEFGRRIELQVVSVPSDGEGFILWFTDGEMEMFGGHAIDATFGTDWQLRSAHLSG